MINLPPEILGRVTQLLLPHVNTIDEREMWLTQAFFLTEPRLYSQITREGGSPLFMTRCIKTLLALGCLPNERHALNRTFVLAFSENLLQDRRVFDLLVAGQQQHFGNHFRRFWIVIGKR